MSPCLLLLELLRNCHRSDSSWVTWGTKLGRGGYNQGSRALFIWANLSLPFKLGFSPVRVDSGPESWDLVKADVKTEVWPSLGLVTQEEYMQGGRGAGFQDPRF